MKNIAVFFGGASLEHDVSVITGVMTVNSLDKNLFCPVPVYVDGKGGWWTGDILKDVDNYKNLDCKKLKKVTFVSGGNVLYAVKKNRLKSLCAIACAVNCMHGERGEDGALAGLLALCEVPLASPAVLPSAVAMDKWATKIFLRGLKIKAVKGIKVSSVTDIKEAEKKLKYPMIVKPVLGGSSIGVNKAENRGELKSAILSSLRYGKEVIIENMLQDFTEINSAAYVREDGYIAVSPCEMPIGAGGTLTFADKYEKGKREFPANIPEEIAEKIKETTRKVYAALGFSGIIRVDYMVKDGAVYLNEINSVPGSLAYYLFTDTMRGFSALITRQITVAERNFAVQSTVKRVFKTSLFEAAGLKGAKRLKNGDK